MITALERKLFALLFAIMGRDLLFLYNDFNDPNEQYLHLYVNIKTNPYYSAYYELKYILFSDSEVDLAELKYYIEELKSSHKRLYVSLCRWAAFMLELDEYYLITELSSISYTDILALRSEKEKMLESYIRYVLSREHDDKTLDKLRKMLQQMEV